MNFDLKQIVSATVVLFAIIDILGSIPIILNIRKKGVKINPLVVSSFAFGILMLFLFFGDFILQLFNNFSCRFIVNTITISAQNIKYCKSKMSFT